MLQPSVLIKNTEHLDAGASQTLPKFEGSQKLSDRVTHYEFHEREEREKEVAPNPRVKCGGMKAKFIMIN